MRYGCLDAFTQILLAIIAIIAIGEMAYTNKNMT